MIKLVQGFDIRQPLPIDGRILLSEEEMRNIDTNLMPDKYFAINKDDGRLYLFDKNNSTATTTGGFRPADDAVKAYADEKAAEIESHLDDYISEEDLAEELVPYAKLVEAANKIDFEMDPVKFILKLILKNNEGEELDAVNIDLPLEQLVVDAEYDEERNVIILYVQSETSEIKDIEIPLGDLVSSLVSKVEFEEHANNIDMHISDEERLKWNDAAEKADEAMRPDDMYTHINAGENVSIDVDDNGDITINAEDTVYEAGRGINIIDGVISSQQADPRWIDIIDDSTQGPMDNPALANLFNAKQDEIEDLADIREGAALGETALQPEDLAEWAKNPNKPTYTAQEVGALPDTTVIPSTVAELEDASDYATKDYVEENGGKIDSISVNGIEQQIDQDKNVDITVPDAASLIATHNLSNEAHADIRSLISQGQGGLDDRLSDVEEVIPSGAASDNLLVTASELGDVADDVSNVDDRVAAIEELIPDTATSQNKLATADDVDNVATTASQARSDASSALTTAQSAGQDAASAIGTANQASYDASSALSRANTAIETANNASTNAQSAVSTANGASTTAQQALTAASSAQSAASAAQAAVNGLATVATSGSYNDLLNKPTIPAAQVNSDWNASSGVAQILNKPTIPTVPTNVSAFNNDAGYLTSFTETDPTVPAWAKASTKPTYTAAEVGAIPDTTDVVTSITVNGSSKTPTSGAVDLGTVVNAGDGITVSANNTVGINSVTQLNIPNSGWTTISSPTAGAFGYSKTISNSNIKGGNPIIDFDASTYTTAAAYQTGLADYNKIYRAVATSGSITFYAVAIPSAAIKVNILGC